MNTIQKHTAWKQRLTAKIFRVLLVLGMISPGLSTRASHIVGGEMFYDHIGNGTYRVYIILYRDCNSTGAAYDPQASLGIFNAAGALVENRLVPFPGSNILPVVASNPCVTPPNNICTERAIYTTDVVLPPIVGGYNLVYQRCCRGPNIINLTSPDDTGLTLVAHIPGSDTGNSANSSPRFNNYPPLVICNNDQLIFDHSATDPDGDELTYSLYTPNEGATDLAPMPSPPPPPPYLPVTWSNGHSATIPLGPGSSTTVGAASGLMLAQPNLLGQYVVGVKVEERRNGVLLSSSVRDFLFVVYNCVLELEAIVPEQEELSTFDSYCDLTINFENNSYGGNNYYWDFGDPFSTTDFSTQFAPTYTYSQSGDYVAMLVVNPGDPCTDTTYMNIHIEGAVGPLFSATDSVCFIDNSIDFQQTSNNPASTSYTWDFGPNATPQNATGPSVSGVNFNVSGTIPVSLHAQDGVCDSDTTLDIYIYAFPNVDFEMPDRYECDGQSVSFINNTTDALFYQWDFGEPGGGSQSMDFEPSWTFGGPGVYSIQLIAGSTGDCVDTIVKDIEIFRDMNLGITHDDSLCITNNAFDFWGTVEGPDIATYTWDFGPYASPSTSTDTNVLGVNFSIPGTHNVTLTGGYLNCTNTVSTSIFIFREPEIDFRLMNGKQCVPFSAQFYDESISDTPLTYLWDFGNGQTSNVPNPSIVFDEPGNYIITLSISTDEGCESALTLTKDNIVNVRPKPVAAFSISDTLIDICPGALTLFNQSEGAVASEFFFLNDNNRLPTNQPEFTYNFSTSGTQNIRLVVENEYECMDTTTESVKVLPYTVYVPNAFTPNDDKYNNTFFSVAAMPAEEWHFQIFNRWGTLIFESFDQDAVWDGTFDGKVVPDGIYLYKLQLTACGSEDRLQNYTGHIAILK